MNGIIGNIILQTKYFSNICQVYDTFLFTEKNCYCTKHKQIDMDLILELHKYNYFSN